MNLYRHPDALCDPSISFTRLHDYYSFGVVLVEIAMWRSIKTILRNHQKLQGEECGENDARKVRDILLDESQENIPREIAFRAGDTFREVIRVCLTGEFGAGGPDRWLGEFSRRVAEELERCTI